jgi:hypothetical protein
MALNGNVLGDLMVAYVDALSVEEKRDRVEVFRAMGRAIVDHIVSSAVVNSNVFVASVTGVTAGAQVSGPGAGTAVGTIT